MEGPSQSHLGGVWQPPRWRIAWRLFNIVGSKSFSLLKKDSPFLCTNFRLLSRNQRKCAASLHNKSNPTNFFILTCQYKITFPDSMYRYKYVFVTINVLFTRGLHVNALLGSRGQYWQLILLFPPCSWSGYHHPSGDTGLAHLLTVFCLWPSNHHHDSVSSTCCQCR